MVLFVVSLGIFLRLIFIDKPDGLWNDEYVSWYVASIPYGKTFWHAVFAQCHMPLYYFYLKFFIHFFGNNDLILRLTSVLPGVLSIVSMYFVGKELKDNQTNVMLNSFQHRINERPCDPETSSGRRVHLGILCAAITSFSSFLIYFSQEVRFYALLFLFSSLVLLFTLKLLKEQKLSNIIFFTIFNLLVIFTHTLGFVFVFFNLVFVSRAGFISPPSRQSKVISLWLPILLLSLIALPLLFSILTTHSQVQFWGSFTISKLGFLITDYFSPILTNIVSAPDSFFYNFSLLFIIFAIIPSVIAIAGITKALLEAKCKVQSDTALVEKRNLEMCHCEERGTSDAAIQKKCHCEEGRDEAIQKENYSPFTINHALFYICLAYILTLVIVAISGKLVFITKYSIEIYPILIALMAFGLLEFQKKWRYVLIFLFCFLNLFYVLVSHKSAPKLHRSEGHKITAELIKNAKLNKDDMILLTYYTQDRFEKYFNFSNYRVISINKGNFSQYLGVNSKEDFKKFNEKIFADRFRNEVVNQLKPNQKVAVVVLNDVSMYSPVQIHQIITSEKLFKKIPYMFLIFSELKNEIIKEGLQDLQIQRLEQKGSWSVITFIKK